MSIECRYCERDVRAGHAPDCPRFQRKAGKENDLAALAGQMRDLAADMSSTLDKAAAKPLQRPAVKTGSLAFACGYISEKLADGKPVMLPGVGRLTVIERTVRGVRRSHVKFEPATALKNAIGGQKRGAK